MTQVNVDFKRYERAAIWTEFWFGQDKEPHDEPIFRQEKTNLPKNYSVPEGLRTFLNSVRSEIQDPRNRISEKSNLPPEEEQALRELRKLQKDKQIVIKACDKGAG